MKTIPAISRIWVTLDISSWHWIKEPSRKLLATKVNVEVMLARLTSDEEVLRKVRIAVNWPWDTALPIELFGRNWKISGLVTNFSTVQYSRDVLASWHSNVTFWLRHAILWWRYCTLEVSWDLSVAVNKEKLSPYCKLLATHVTVKRVIEGTMWVL